MLVYPLVGLLAVVATGVTATLVARQLSAPTAKPLLGACLFLVVAAVSQVVVLTPSPVRAAILGTTAIELPGDYWLALALGLTLPACGLWLLFSVQHTGRGSRFRRKLTALVAALIGSFYLVPIYVLFRTGAGRSGDTVVAGIFATGLFFVSTLASLGTLLVLEAALRRNAIPLGEGATLAGGGSLFIYAPIVTFNLDRPMLFPVFLFGASLLLGVAVTRYPVFETLPVARIAARDRLIEEMEDAVLLVDEQARVVELNPAAASLFDVDPADAGQRSLQEVFPDAPDPDALVAASEPSRFRTGGRRLEVTASRVVGEYGTSVGYLLVCRDTTERGRRERRLGVLTRFLAGTVGKRTATVARRADQIANGDGNASDTRRPGDDPTAVAREIRQTTGSLKRLVSATRHVERALSDRGTGPSDVVALLGEITAERERVALTVEEPRSEATAAVDPAVLRAVLELLIEDLLERGPGGVQLVVRPSRDPGPVIELQGDPPATTGERDTGGESVEGAPEEQDRRKCRPNTREEPTIALSRLALEHAGGSVERSHGSSLRVLLRTDLPTSTGDSPVGDNPGSGTSQKRASGTGNTGDKP